MFLFAEFIITFDGYYKTHTRLNFIRAALNNSDVSSWTIKERNNPAKDFPSDFDVLAVRTIINIFLLIY